jgi:organic radical activating enzyme
MDFKNQQNYCPLFYKGMYVEKKDGHGLRQGHCCSSGLGPKVKTADFYNYPSFVLNRQQWPNNKIKGCDCCWSQEQNNHHSFRKGWLQWLEDQGPDVDPTKPELLKLDYNVGPICNAKCIHCTSNYSSLWAAEDAKFGIQQLSNYGEVSKLDAISTIDVSCLKSLYINGGEPFMSQDPLNLLEKVRQQGNISNLTFQSNTNGSVKPSDEIIDLWLQCKEVDIFVSIDAIEKQFEYVRHPLNWNTVVENIKFLSSIDKKIRVKFSFALGLHNIDELERTWQWFLNNKNSYNQTDESFGIHPCYGALSLNKATAGLQQVWRQTLSPNGRWTQFAHSLLDQGSSESNQSWLDYLSMIDQRRNLNWKNSLPGLQASVGKIFC